MRENLFLMLLVFLVTSCGGKSVDKLKFNKLMEIEEEITANIVATPPQLDILFIVDNSEEAEMSAHRNNLIAFAEDFLQPIHQNQLIDYRVGVVPTQLENSSACRQYWRPQYISRWSSRSLAQRLTQVLERTNCSLESRPFEAARLALTTRGFYRQNASLGIVFVTDRAGHDSWSAREFGDFLLSLKEGNVTKVSLYGVIVEANDPLKCLPPGSETPDQINQVLLRFGGQRFDPCINYFNTEFRRFGENLEYLFGDLFVPLDGVPSEGTLTVEYGGHPIKGDPETGWVYDPVKKGIRFGRQIVLPQTGRMHQFQINFLPGEF